MPTPEAASDTGGENATLALKKVPIISPRVREGRPTRRIAHRADAFMRPHDEREGAPLLGVGTWNWDVRNERGGSCDGVYLGTVGGGDHEPETDGPEPQVRIRLPGGQEAGEPAL